MNLFVSERQPAGILAPKIYNSELDSRRHLLRDIREHNNIHVKRHGFVLTYKLKQISIVLDSVTYDRNENLHKFSTFSSGWSGKRLTGGRARIKGRS